MTPRTTQLDEVWRTALARHHGQPGAALTDTPGPLSRGSLTIYLQSLREMLRGGQYTRAMKNDDTEYFLSRLEQEHGATALRLALSALDQHIRYYNTLGKGALVGARAVHDRWAKRLDAASPQTSPAPAAKPPQQM